MKNLPNKFFKKVSMYSLDKLSELSKIKKERLKEIKRTYVVTEQEYARLMVVKSRRNVL